jgi:hypothetical protein
VRNGSIRLGIIGYLQHKRPSIPVTMSPGLGQLIYTGFEPSFTNPALPITVTSPGVGELIYTGFEPTVTFVNPYNLRFTVNQYTSVGDTPWRAVFYVYDTTFTLRNTITLNVNLGAPTPVASGTRAIAATGFTPLYVDVVVTRQTETTGSPPLDNKMNDSGVVVWSMDSVTLYSQAWSIDTRPRPGFNEIRAFNGLSDGTEIVVDIYEG